MALTVKQTEPDGATVVTDDDGFVAVLKPGQWEEIERLPASEQRNRAEEFVLANKRDTSRDRTEMDEQTIETSQNASTGEMHQESERA